MEDKDKDWVGIDCMGTDWDLGSPALTEQIIANLRGKAAQLESYRQQGFRVVSVQMPFRNIFVNMVRVNTEVTPEMARENLDLPIILAGEHERFKGLRLSLRTFNVVQRAKIFTVRELVVYTESSLLEKGRFGKKRVAEIQAALALLGLRLGMKLD